MPPWEAVVAAVAEADDEFCEFVGLSDDEGCIKVLAVDEDRTEEDCIREGSGCEGAGG